MNCFKKNRKEKYVNLKRKALLIGINYKDTSSALSGCVNDVIDMYNVLKTKGFTEFMILSEKDCIFKKEHAFFIPLINNLPTKNNILNGFSWLTKNSQDYEQIFVHYSGHGSFTYSNSEDEVDHREETLVPLDYNKNGMINDDTINNKLVKDAKCKLFCVIDACHSGSSLDLKYSFGSKMYMNRGLLKSNKNNWNEDYYTIVEPKQSELDKEVYMISGCKDNQTSADAMFDKANGALTFCLLKVLKENNYEITYKKMLKEVNFYIKKYKFSQNPMVSSCKKSGIDDIFKF